MRFKTLANVVAIVLFVAYFSPIVIKLKEFPLTLVVLGGLALALIDVVKTLRNGG